MSTIVENLIKSVIQGSFGGVGGSVLYTALRMGVKMLPLFISGSSSTVSWMSSILWALITLPGVSYFFRLFSLSVPQRIAFSAALAVVCGVCIYFILSMFPALV